MNKTQENQDRLIKMIKRRTADYLNVVGNYKCENKPEKKSKSQPLQFQQTK